MSGLRSGMNSGGKATLPAAVTFTVPEPIHDASFKVDGQKAANGRQRADYKPSA